MLARRRSAHDAGWLRLALSTQHLMQHVAGDSSGWVLQPKHLLLDLHGPPEEPLGLLVLSPMGQHNAKHVEADGRIKCVKRKCVKKILHSKCVKPGIRPGIRPGHREETGNPTALQAADRELDRVFPVQSWLPTGSCSRSKVFKESSRSAVPGFGVTGNPVSCCVPVPVPVPGQQFPFPLPFLRRRRGA